ncbi:MAG: exodeoxyribonuclease VII large subunit [Planctomycetota bacterium]
MSTTVNKNFVTISQLTSLIKEVIEKEFQEDFWVIGEIAQISVSQNGHCFLQLVEKKENDKPVAAIQAVIWADKYLEINEKFSRVCGIALKQGIKILFYAHLTFHQLHGLKVVIFDIDPHHTLGEMFEEKRRVLAQLQAEGVINLNKNLAFPIVPQRIAVISSPSAAGYGDFKQHLNSNPYGYKFYLTLFEALMQGDGAPQSIIEQLNIIEKARNDFDVVVIIRGGGSQVDLSCFDNYQVAKKVALCKLPVLTGIGHEKDETIVDIVAHKKFKTPTAVAEFLYSSLKNFEEKIIACQKNICELLHQKLNSEKQRLKFITEQLKTYPKLFTLKEVNTLDNISKNINIFLKKIFEKQHCQARYLNEQLKTFPYITVKKEDKKINDVCSAIKDALLYLLKKHNNKINTFEQIITFADPQNILKRGYSITYYQDKVLKSVRELKRNETIYTKLYEGKIESMIKSYEENKNE